MSKLKLATMMLLVVSTAGAGLFGYQTATRQDKAPATAATAPPHNGAGCAAPVDGFFADGFENSGNRGHTFIYQLS